MSHETASSTSTPESSNASTGETIANTPERVAVRDILLENPHLQRIIEDDVRLAVSDVRELRAAADKAGRNFVVGVQLDALLPKSMPLKIKRGRIPLEEKAAKARRAAQKYSELEEKERLQVQAAPGSNNRTSRKSRKMARKEIRQKHKAEKLQGKIDYLTEFIAKEPLRKWEKENNPTRNTEGFQQLKDNLAKIKPELERRKTLRSDVEQLEKLIDAGTVTPGTPLYDQYLERKREVESWGDETDKELTDRLKVEATHKYSEWLHDQGNEERIKNYQTAEKKINQRLEVEDKINDPNTLEAERKKLKEWSSNLAPLEEFGAKLVRGDVQGFSDWISQDANRELDEAFNQIEKNIKEEYKNELKELHGLTEQYEQLFKTNEWLDQQITNASSDEEKARWQRISIENDKEMTKLKKRLDDGYTKIEADRGFDEDRAKEAIINKRMRIVNLWQDSRKNS